LGLYSFIYREQFKWRQKITGWTVAARNKFTGKNHIAFEKEERSPKILFILTGLIGDCIMCTPVILQSKKIWPGSDITVLGKKANLELLRDSPAVDHFYETPFSPFSIKGWRKKKLLATWLKKEQFEIAIILTGDHFAKMLYDAKIPVRVGAKGHFLQSCLTHIYDTVSPIDWNHEIRLNALRCLGYSVENVLPELGVGDEIIESMYKKLKGKGFDGDRYIVLHPFGSSFRQWWNLTAVTDLVNELYANYKCRTVLIGGPETTGVLEPIDKLIDTTGCFSIGELKAVIAKAMLVVTTDSGPFHIAGAFGKKTVGLFRAVRAELASVYPGCIAIKGENETCQKICSAYKCRELKCIEMNEISVRSIIKASSNLTSTNSR